MLCFQTKRFKLMTLLNLYLHRHAGNMGRQYTLLGDSDFAEELYKYAIEVAPDVWLPFMNYGVLLKKQRRLDEAEAVSELHAISCK